MHNTARLYHCARCRRQVTICSHCDRGNSYCGKACADLARKSSQKAAGKRYQRSRRGRFKHADRQRRYRARRKKVTHHGSPLRPSNDPLTLRSEASETLAVIEDGAVRCHFCRRGCSPFLRLDFLHGTRVCAASDRNVMHRPRPLQAQAP